MADEPKAKPEPEARMRLKSIEDLTNAHEWLFQKQQSNEIDAKTADALNTTLKGAVYLNAKLKIEYAKIMIQARVKKVTFAPGMLPELPT